MPVPARTSRWAWANALAVPLVLAALGALFAANPRGAEVSEVENRKLAKMPALSWDALYAGSYTRDVELYVADHFPLRDPFVSLAFWLKARRGLHSETSYYADPETGGLDDADDWARPPDEADGGGADGGATGPSKFFSRAGVVIHRGRAMMLFSGTDESAKVFSSTVNLYADWFGKDAAIRLIVVPNATSYYLPDDARARTRSEKDNLAAIKAGLDPRVQMVDIYSALERHTAEPIYYRTDHHWTGLGAYYGYQAYCETAGLSPMALGKMEKKTRPAPAAATGWFYRMTHDDSLLEIDDPTQYFVPPGEVETVRYVGDEQKSAIKARFIDEDAKGYLVYLGGDWGVMIGRTKAANGKRALLIKNSFGNAFAPYLLAHYEEVVVVDYRYTVRSVSELVRQHKITDIILLADTVTANFPMHQARLKEIIRGHDAAWTVGRGNLFKHDAGTESASVGTP
jgi:hypothetical protein